MYNKQNLFFDLEKFIECLGSNISLVWSNPYVRPFPRIKVDIFIL